MATNPFKHPPPTPSTNSENCSTYDDYDEQAPLRLSSASATSAGSSVSSTPDSSSILKQRAPCACSNISIMQLFHEMKQKYPTVPDTVVSELVTQNCHDRPACVSKLEEAVLGTPAQTTYPAHSTMGYAGGGSGVPPPPPTRPHRTAPACPPNGSLATSTITTTTTASGNADLGETVNLQVNVTVSPKAGGPLHVGQRHTSTISLQPEPPYSRELAQVSSTFNSGVAASAGSGLGAGPSQGNASGGVAGGGGSNGNAVGAGGSAGGRSSTSVNLTLRQPTDGRPHSPIHIHASPLKYTAKNFNAQAGIQSKLEVTFRDGFGSFSAMRAHVPGYESYQGTHRPLDTQATSLNTLQYQQQQLQEPVFEQRDNYRYQSPRTAMPSRFQTPLSSSSPLPSVVHREQTSRGLMGALRGGSLFATDGKLENDGLTKEMRYQNFVVAGKV
ncbi:hypothetical protein ZHAS_00018334 [Anopheles sinensis]|uniref:CUE domain-containing protein n=1 Tax=Anopheles sinensis TaxID=74873 RepID=A0A084WJ63_ANOSI|nr:hypothetical protein ZHAS_00018334 [Anopheles sinensis]